MLQTAGRREVVAGACGDRILPRQTPWATTTSMCIPTRRAHRRVCACISCGSRKSKPQDQAQLCLFSDFVAPVQSARADYIGAIRGGPPASGIDAHVARFEGRARRLQQHHAEKRWPIDSPRRWPSACTNACAANSGAMLADEHLDSTGLIDEKYQGIRPAPGYPACPDHTEKQALWKLLDAEAQCRHPADRNICDVPHRGGQRFFLFFTSPGSLFRRREKSTAIKWRATRSAREWNWEKPSVGWRRFWATTRMPRPRLTRP